MAGADYLCKVAAQDSEQHEREHKAAHHEIPETAPMSADRPAGLFGRLFRKIRPGPSSRAAAGNQAVVRRLAAIVAIDMVGYSKLMGVDETGTLAALRGLRQQLIDPVISTHRGRIVKTTGDGLLLEFASVVDAVQCAIEIQSAMRARQPATEAEDRRITLRIGVNLGEIIFEGGDIYGDGVNIAARLEQLAQPGGVCISHPVYKECRGRIDGAFADGGDRELKNITRPVHVWHWQSAPEAGPAMTAQAQAQQDKISIAVLPFVNISSDPEQEYFADGMTEDIITGLSCDSRLFVIARNSTFAYKGQSPDIRAVGKELGVRYVLEGSIRPMGDRLRINVQLIETGAGGHVWADKIDRPIAEIFTIMDEVVDGLVTTLCANLGVVESKRAGRQRPESLQAWALCVQAEVLFLSQAGANTHLEVEKLARRAAGIEPDYAISWALLGLAVSRRLFGWQNENAANDTEETLALISKALSLAPNDPVVLGYCGAAAYVAGQASQATDYLERSLARNPNNSFSQVYYGAALNFDGRPAEGLSQLELFLRRSPKDPNIALAHYFSAFCYLRLGDYPAGEISARNCIRLQPNFTGGYFVLTAALVYQGHDSEAIIAMRKIKQLRPEILARRPENDVHGIFSPTIAGKAFELMRQAWEE